MANFSAQSRKLFLDILDIFGKLLRRGNLPPPEKLAILMRVKNEQYGRVTDYVQQAGGNIKFLPGARPWGVKADVALPCAQGAAEETLLREQIFFSRSVAQVGGGGSAPDFEARLKFDQNRISSSFGPFICNGGIEMVNFNESTKFHTSKFHSNPQNGEIHW